MALMDGRKALLPASSPPAAQFFGLNNQNPQPPMSTTPETSDFSEDRQLDVTIGDMKEMKIFALRQYNQATRDGAYSVISYWDGYLGCISHVLDADEE
jgi:hypothetical protein